MKILVFAHDYGVGGSQLNAIEIAATLRDMGQETILFGRPGPLNKRVDELGLEFIEAPVHRGRPSPGIVRALTRTIDQRGIDILHGYEWPPALECSIASRLRPRTRSVSTVMSMSVAPFLPMAVPLLVGTQAIAHYERLQGRQTVVVQEPPVDLDFNRPDGRGGQTEFRRRWGLRYDAPIVVMVSRLAHELKREGILAAIQALALVPADRKIQLVIVGGGPAETEIRLAAEKANKELSGHRVVLTGEMDDPRPAYGTADVVLGMGGSALRGLAFGKPLVVQGEKGFWRLLTPGSLPDFLWQGWYGIGQDPSEGQARLAGILDGLLTDTERATELGRFGLQTARERYSLKQAAEIQLGVYEAALERKPEPSHQLAMDSAAALKFLRYESRRRLARLRGRQTSDDFNANPVAISRPEVVAHG
ncbi:glycosyltransferase [Paeniglutamicibacter psychrophenolicus]|uniref:glycosyltransferase n=1 Tax=Paeniglutamicibacter psychrophenolicus TaxID=257454 RepID=UPI00277FCCF2|nr:glycosyltransferase [Paeniglutamicibacter psychrophenolicus]MDQ0092647.1 glycosyltransferase involved in cell wall biosynthesis [Paeniglutamicibacter psychrophenolicus]